jgi:hypothetical protein
MNRLFATMRETDIELTATITPAPVPKGQMSSSGRL